MAEAPLGLPLPAMPELELIREGNHIVLDQGNDRLSLLVVKSNGWGCVFELTIYLRMLFRAVTGEIKKCTSRQDGVPRKELCAAEAAHRDTFRIRV